MPHEHRVPPTGTVTFVFTDIEGSTTRWDTNRAAMQAAVRRHDDLMRGAIGDHGGFVFKTIGDAFCAAFAGASDALAATLAAQRAIAAADWGDVGGLRVRMAIHTGEADERDADYFGPSVNRVARLLGIAHGGQVLVSGASQALVEPHLPPHSALHDLGIHRLKDLSTPEHVYQLWVADLPGDFPPLRSLDALPNNLPIQLTSLVGRESEEASVKELVAESRVVTLIGPGGIGKTRLALQVAADLATDDGAWFVDLAPVGEDALVAGAIAAVFNVSDEGGGLGLMDRIVAALKTKKLVLLLDNCEHLIGAAAQAVDRIVRACPNVRILATSREALGIGGEVLFRMPTLPVPAQDCASAAAAMQYGAVALFVARAKAAHHGFALTDQNVGHVAEIVRRLDGIALAIELAASRVKVLSPAQLAQRLDDRLKLLTGGSRSALPRQQTLRALIAWSYDLLSETERRMFRTAAVFRGSWSLEAAEEILADEDSSDQVLDVVIALADKSMLVVDVDESDQRYRLLESIREFALERLAEAGELEAASARHCRYYAGLAAEIGSLYWKMDTDAWTALARRDLENYRHAIQWGLTMAQDVAGSAAIVGSLRWLWDETARREGRALVTAVLDALTPEVPARIRGLVGCTAGLLAMSASAREKGIDALELLAAKSDAVERAEALNTLAESVGDSGDFPKTLALLEEAIGIARAAALPRFAGFLLSSAAYWRACAGDAAGAQEYFQEAAPIVRRFNDLPKLGRLQAIRAELLFAAGATDAALECVREAESIFRERGNIGWLSIALLNRAAYLISYGALREAWSCAREALDLSHRREDQLIVAVAIAHLARVAAETGRLQEAARLIGFADAAYSRIGRIREPTEKQSYDRTVELVRAAPLERGIERSIKAGSEMDQDGAVAEALAIPEP